MPAPTSEGARRLPFAGSDRVAVVAGEGALPLEVALALRAAGHEPFLVALAGEGDEERFAGFARASLALEESAGLFPLLRRERVTHVIFAGGVGRRPDLRKVPWTIASLRLAASMLVPLARGDDNLLAAVVAYTERQGFKVVGADAVVPDLRAPLGVMTRAAPLAADEADIEAAREAARAIGALDIGQAAVAIGGRAVALEGIEGTDGLLERVVALRQNGRIATKRRGVLVKCSKPGQELRVDLPTIGVATVERAHAAGLAGIAVEAGRSLVVDMAQTVAAADRHGLFILGFPAEEGR
jgi:DUF1009 family protein